MQPLKTLPVVLVGLQECTHSIDVDVYHLTERSNGGCGLTRLDVRRSEYATYPGDWMRVVDIGQCIYAVDLHSAHFGETRDYFLQPKHTSPIS